MPSDFKREALRERELRSGVPEPFRRLPGYIPAALADKTDVHIARGGNGELAVRVAHGSLVEAATGRRDRSTWCARCKANEHHRCSGRRHAVRGYAPCLCQVCQKAPGQAENHRREPDEGIHLVTE